MKLTFSDFVDSTGKIFKTIGDNIRNGVRSSKTVSDELSQEFEQDELNSMHVLPFMSGKGKWVLVADTIINGQHNFGKYSLNSTNLTVYFDYNVKYILPSDKQHSNFNSDNKIRFNYLGQSGTTSNLHLTFVSPIDSDDNGKITYFWLWVSEK